MASINRQTCSDFQFCMRNANNLQSLGVHTHSCGRCIVSRAWHFLGAEAVTAALQSDLHLYFRTKLPYCCEYNAGRSWQHSNNYDEERGSSRV